MTTPHPPAPPADDVMAVLADFQTQLNNLNRAVTAQQATIDILVDEVITLLRARTDGQR